MENKQQNMKGSSRMHIEENALTMVLCHGRIRMTKELIYGNEKNSLPKVLTKMSKHPEVFCGTKKDVLCL